MRAATSSEAMMPYCGEVEVCIMKASLNRSWSMRRSGGKCRSRRCTIEAWDKAASSLWVDWVAKIAG